MYILKYLSFRWNRIFIFIICALHYGFCIAWSFPELLVCKFVFRHFGYIFWCRSSLYITNCVFDVSGSSTQNHVKSLWNYAFLDAKCENLGHKLRLGAKPFRKTTFFLFAWHTINATQSMHDLDKLARTFFKTYYNTNVKLTILQKPKPWTYRIRTSVSQTCPLRYNECSKLT